MKMINCEEATLLMSEALDHPLSWSQRGQLRFHLWMCKNCPGYSRQIQFIHQALHHWHPPDDPNQRLSPEARKKIKKALRDQLTEEGKRTPAS